MSLDTTIAVTSSDVTCYIGNQYSSSWNTTTNTNKHFCASWTEWYSGNLSNYNQKRSRIKIHTDASGATSISITLTLTGRHSWTSSQTVGKIYWTVTDSNSSNPSSGSALTLNGSTVGSTATGTRSQSLLPNRDYWVWVWCTATTDTYGTSIRVVTSGTYGVPGNITTTKNNVSVTGINFGDTVTIGYEASPATGATYTVTVSVPKTDGTNWTSTLQSRTDTDHGGDRSVSWQPTVNTFKSIITDRQSVSATITVTTYYGNDFAGTKTKSLTLTFLAADVGIIGASGWASVAPHNIAPIAGKSGYIQGYSKAAITLDTAYLSLSSTSLKNWSVKVGNTTTVLSPPEDDPLTEEVETTASFTTDVLSTATEIVITATDNRGFFVSQTFNIAIIEYAYPTVSATFYKERLDNDPSSPTYGQYFVDESGTYLNITATSSCSPLTYNGNAQNSVTSVKLSWRIAGQSAWSEPITLASGSNRISGFDDHTYELKLTVTDSLENSTSVEGFTVYTAKWLLRGRPNAAGIAFGKAAEYDNQCEIPDTWDYYRGTKKLLPVDEIYPVGSIYMSVNSTDPGTLFGGTWARITGKFLLAATDGGSSGASQAAGNTGGEATHTLTTDEMPSHGHKTLYYNSGGDQSWGFNFSSPGGLSGNTQLTSSGIEPTGGGGAHNNMPPYLAVYIWQRTA